MTVLWGPQSGHEVGLRCDGCGSEMRLPEMAAPRVAVLDGGWVEVVDIIGSGEAHYCAECWAPAGAVLKRAA
jgi:hypothetical protein